MDEWRKEEQGRQWEGYAFTFCKAAFLILIFQRYALLALSGLSVIFYLMAQARGVEKWRCWAKPPWVTLFWGAIFSWQCWLTFFVKGAGGANHFWLP